MGRASSRKWDRRYRWPAERFMKLRKARPWRYICKRMVNDAESLIKMLPSLYEDGKP